MPSCIFRRCTNYTATVRDKKNVSFHVLPRDGLMKEKWLNIIRSQRRENDWLPSDYTTICSEHFLAKDIYLTKNNVRRLRKTAIPVIKHEELNISSPTSLESVNLSDESEIFVTPRRRFSKPYIKENCLNKRKLKSTNYNFNRKNKKLNPKYNDLKEIIWEVQTKKYITVDQFNELYLKAEAVEFTNRLIQKTKFKDYRKNYTPALRKFAVTLHYYSAAAYKYVRHIFSGALPHPSVIGKWYENASGDPGFNKQSLDILEKTFMKSGQRILCTLIVGEMALCHQSKWNGKKDRGVVDFGAGPTSSHEIATQAYVFILVCLNKNWKIPVAYFLVNTLSAESRANLIKTCLIECYNVGVDIVAITFDGGTRNINAANLLGCDLKDPACLKTTFKHPVCDLQVAIMLDICHIFKLVRNSFETKRLIYDEFGRKIRWQLIVNLMKLQKNVGLNFSNKLNTRYIHFRNEIMKVKLATQVMSMTVANALRLCNEIITSSLFVDTEGTIDFITILNNLFDIFNSKNSDLYDLKKPLSSKNADGVIAYLGKVKQYILGLNINIKYKCIINGRRTVKVIRKKIVESNNKTGFLGFLVCIESLKYLYSTLVEGQRSRDVATYRLSQDHIEILFDAIKRHGKYINNPNAIRFKGIFKKILLYSEKWPFLGNFVASDYIPVLPYSSAIKNINSTIDRRASDDEYDIFDSCCNEKFQCVEENHIIDGNVSALSTILNHESEKETIDQIIGYISASVSKKLVTLLKCEICVDSLFSETRMWFHKLIVLKNMRGLCFPSEDVFKICLRSEMIINNRIKENGHLILRDAKAIEIMKTRILKSFTCSDIFESLNTHALQQHPIFNHRLHLIRAIIEIFINVRIYFTNESKSDCKTKYNREKRNKLSLFEVIQNKKTEKFINE